jgi:hypothetical protein
MGGQEVTGGPPAVEQLHRGAFKSREGSETQKGRQPGERSEESGGEGAKSSCLTVALGRSWLNSDSISPRGGKRRKWKGDFS